jgi:hypothetical protein
LSRRRIVDKDAVVEKEREDERVVVDFCTSSDVSFVCSTRFADKDKADMENKLCAIEDVCLLPQNIEKSSPNRCRKIDDIDNADILYELDKAKREGWDSEHTEVLPSTVIQEGGDSTNVEVPPHLMNEENKVNSKLKFALLNCRSLGQRKANLLSLIEEQNLDILALTETWYYTSSQLPTIPGYKVWYNFREQEEHGGIVVWVKETIETSTVPTPKLVGKTGTEQVWLRCIINKECTIRLGTVYWPQDLKKDESENFLDEIRNQLVEADKSGEECYVIGDFNCHMYKLFEPITGIRDQYASTGWNQQGRDLFALIKGAGMDVLNITCGNKPGWTRTQKFKSGKTERAVLDLVLFKGKSTRHSLYVDNKKIHWSGSDHHLVSWTRDNTPVEMKSKKKKTPRWDVTNIKNDWDKFRKFLDEIVLSKSDTYSNAEMERKFNLNLRWITEAASETIKQTGKKTNNPRKDFKKILSEDVQFLTAERAEMRRDHREANRNKDTTEMSRIARCILEKTRDIKRQEDHEVQQKTLKLCDDMANKDHKDMDLYKHVSDFKSQKSQTFGLKKEDGSYADSAPDIDNLLTDMWENQIYKKRKWDTDTDNRTIDLDISEEDKKVTQEFTDKPITIQEVDLAIKHLKTGTSHGTTQVAPEMLKNTGPQFRENLRTWMNMCFEDGILPAINEIMRITMLHKKGPTSTLKNYRSLAVGCNICKILLKIIGWRIEIVAEFLEILGEMQAGLRNGRRTQDNLIILDTIFRYVRESQANDHKLMIAMMDISKAYDRVDRDILWEKMNKYGFSKKILNFLSGTYKDARGVIHFQGIESSEKRLEIGLKQGCVLSPILFAIYICELERKLLATGIGPLIGGQRMPGMMFADDKIIIAPFSQFQALLDVVGEFAHRNKIEFSGAKSIVIPLYRDADPNIKWKVGYLYNDEGEKEDIVMSECVGGKYLGVQLKRGKPHYAKHLEDAQTKAKRFLWPIGRMIKGLGRKIQVTHKIWEIYCIRRIIYGLDIAEVNQSCIDALDIIQNKVARMALEATPWTKKVVLQGECNFQPFVFRIMKEKLNLLAYLSSLEDTRWAKKALIQQREWLDRDMKREGWATKKNPDYWFQQVVMLANELQIPQAVYLNDNTASKGASGIEVRNSMIRKYNTDKERHVDRRDYLRYYRDQWYPKIDVTICKWDGSYFWRQLKTGLLAEKYDDRFDFNSGIPQNIRDKTIFNRSCPVCDQPDSIEHALWICTAIKEKNRERKVFIPVQYKDRLVRELSFITDLENITIHEAFLVTLWLLSADQPFQLKMDIGCWIKKTLESRQELVRLKEPPEP